MNQTRGKGEALRLHGLDKRVQTAVMLGVSGDKHRRGSADCSSYTLPVILEVNKDCDLAEFDVILLQVFELHSHMRMAGA